MGKEKVEERKDNVSTKLQNHQKNSGQVDLGIREHRSQSNASWNAEDDWYTAEFEFSDFSGS